MCSTYVLHLTAVSSDTAVFFLLSFTLSKNKRENMELKQDLQNYIDAYKNASLWEVFETEHYVFHYVKNSIAEHELKYIAKTQEKAYAKIIKTLGLREAQAKIKYYIYQSEAEKEKLMGDNGFAQAIWHDNSIHIVYTEDIKPIGEHEDVHLLILPWGVAIGFFQEGLAEYMSGCVWGKERKPAEIFVKKGVVSKEITDLENFFSHTFWMKNMDENIEYYYPLAGTFTRFLISEFGLEKYKKFYMKVHRENTKEENIKIFQGIFGDLQKIAKNYLKIISAVQM